MINRCLMRIGAQPLQSESAPGAPQRLEVYEAVVERLGAHPWTFMKTTRRLARLTDAPSPKFYKYAFQLPSDMPGAPRAVYDSETMRTPTTAYDIEGESRLLANAEAIWISYSTLANPARWPGDFRELFATALMAEYALAIREDRPLHDRLYLKAFGTPSQDGKGGMFATALELDSQSVPSTVVGGGFNPLIDVR